jgi:hypothetical protein
MAFQDRYGNALSTASAEARDHYVRGVDHLLEASHGGRAAFEAALAADPAFALGHAGLARAAMIEGDMPAAKVAIAAAEALADGLTERERGHIGAFSLLLAGRPADCRAHVRAHVLAHPRDAFCAQLCASVFGLIGFSGCAGREADQLAYTSHLIRHHGDDWWATGAHAQALCEAGRVAESMALMERSLAMNPRNANAAHFKGHALYEQGDVESGRAYLADWMEGYDRRAPLHGHLSWHVALWALAAGDLDAMWATLDGAVGPETGFSPPINVLTDTAAILHRAAIAGVAVPPARWRAVSDYAARHFPAPGTSFADLHAALAHAMAGDTARLAPLLEARDGPAADLVRPAAAAWRAMAAGDWAAALDALTPVLAAHERLGGSRAQRDLLEFAHLDVLVKLGRRDEAKRQLAMRRAALRDAAPVAGLN